MEYLSRGQAVSGCFAPAVVIHKHSQEIDGARCLCARINRIIGTDCVRWLSRVWAQLDGYSFGLPVGARG